MSMANVGTPSRAGLAHARRRFDIVLEVEDALGALVPEHPHAVETGGVVAVAVAEQEVHPGDLGLLPDPLGDHVHDRNRFQVRQVADGQTLATAGFGRSGLGHRRLVGLHGADVSGASGLRRLRRSSVLAGSVESVGPDSAPIGDAATSIAGITTNSADNLRLDHALPPHLGFRAAGLESIPDDPSGRRFSRQSGPASDARTEGCHVAVHAAATLIEIERRVLWLATRMIDAANRERPAPHRSCGTGRRVSDQGRRPPGVLGVDGRDHDRAVVRPPATAPTRWR